MNSNSVTVDNRRLDLLDFFRGVAILIVVMYHYTARYDNHFLGYDGSTIGVTFGHYGVQLFFAVSGFCIAMTASSTHSAKVFLAKRISRIYPAYFAAAIVTFAVLTWMPTPEMTVGLKDVFGSWMFLGDHGFKWVDGAYWSLAVEMRFYILFAIAYYRPKWVLPIVCVAALIFGASLIHIVASGRIHLHALVNDPLIKILDAVFIFEYMPWFLLGIGLYWLHVGGHEKKVTRLLTASVLLAGFISVWDKEIMGAYLLVVLAMGCVILLPRLRIPSWLSFVGVVSYPLYLVHQNIGIMIIRNSAGIGNDYARMGLAFVVVFGIALALHYGVEFRYRRRLDAFLVKAMTHLSALVARFQPRRLRAANDG